jgi:hypothetical protein
MNSSRHNVGASVKCTGVGFSATTINYNCKILTKLTKIGPAAFFKNLWLQSEPFISLCRIEQWTSNYFLSNLNSIQMHSHSQVYHPNKTWGQCYKTFSVRNLLMFVIS